MTSTKQLARLREPNTRERPRTSHETHHNPGGEGSFSPAPLEPRVSFPHASNVSQEVEGRARGGVDRLYGGVVRF
jgi:hypothetical protein